MSFQLSDILGEQSLKPVKREDKLQMIPAGDLLPSSGNFYSKEDDRIKKMAASILMLSTPDRIGIQQNLVVKPIDGSDTYMILAGETRWRAVNYLLEAGELETDLIPCEVEQEGDPIRDELILIMTNSTQRERSDAEKMHEVSRLRVLLEEYKKTHKLGSTIQQAIGDMLGISKTKVGTLENIDRNLSPELREDYEAGRINTSVANKLAGMDKPLQEEGKKLLDEQGSISGTDVGKLAERFENMDVTLEDSEEDFVFSEGDIPVSESFDDEPDGMIEMKVDMPDAGEGTGEGVSMPENFAEKMLDMGFIQPVENMIPPLNKQESITLIDDNMKKYQSYVNQSADLIKKGQRMNISVLHSYLILLKALKLYRQFIETESD